MNNILEYKGYCTKVDFSAEDGVLFGKIEGIRDLVTFECDCASEAQEAFFSAVDDYLESCRDIGKEPDKEYKGTFNIRISSELHKKASMLAYRRNQSLNQIVEESIASYVNGTNSSEISLRETVATLTTALVATTYQTYPTPKINPIYTHQSTGNGNIIMSYLQ